MDPLSDPFEERTVVLGTPQGSATVTLVVCRPMEKAGFPNAFSTRLGGVSPLPNEDLHLVYRDDDPDRVSENRRRFLSAIGRPEAPVATVKQTHSIRHVWAASAGTPEVEADAISNGRPGLFVGVKTADCLPVLLADPSSGLSSAVHAGWRGAAGRLAAIAAQELSEKGADLSRTLAALGPCACAACYEVGSDVETAFGAQAAAGIGRQSGRLTLDLRAVTRAQLIEAGLRPENIFVDDHCTMHQNHLFFSHRREHPRGAVGRMLSVVGRFVLGALLAVGTVRLARAADQTPHLEFRPVNEKGDEIKPPEGRWHVESDARLRLKVVLVAPSYTADYEMPTIKTSEQPESYWRLRPPANVTLTAVRESADGHEEKVPIDVRHATDGNKEINEYSIGIEVEFPESEEIRRQKLDQLAGYFYAKAQAEAGSNRKKREEIADRDAYLRKMAGWLDQQYVYNRPGTYRLTPHYHPTTSGTWHGAVDGTPLEIDVEDLGDSLSWMRPAASSVAASTGTASQDEDRTAEALQRLKPNSGTVSIRLHLSPPSGSLAESALRSVSLAVDSAPVAGLPQPMDDGATARLDPAEAGRLVDVLARHGFFEKAGWRYVERMKEPEAADGEPLAKSPAGAHADIDLSAADDKWIYRYGSAVPWDAKLGDLLKDLYGASGGEAAVLLEALQSAYRADAAGEGKK